MRSSLGLFVLLVSSWAVCQTCATHVMVDPFDDKTKKGIDGLKTEDFQARLGNTSLPIVNSTQRFENRTLILAEVDNSNENPGVAGIANLVANIARDAPPRRLIAFGVFGEKAMFTSGFADNAHHDRSAEIDEVMSKVNSLGTRPAIFDALHEALLFFGKHQPGDTIVLVSDGHDVKSHRNAAELEKEFALQGTRLLVMIRPDERLVGQDWRARKGEEYWNLRELCSRTGGGNNWGLAPEFVELAWTGYLLEIEIPAALDKPKSWKLQLRGAADKAHRNALIFYPWELPPCGAASSAQNAAPK